MSSPDSPTDSRESDVSSKMVNAKAASFPAVAAVPTDEGKLTTQISAPSYLFSLKCSEAPPFRKPEKEARPKILVDTIMTESEAVEMIAAADFNPNFGLKKFLAYFLVRKKVIENYSLSERDFLVGLLTETIDYAAQRDLNAHKLACLITLYLSTHLYFKWYYWTSPSAVWSYFKENMIRHTIEDSPDGQEVFEPEECYDILTHFHTIYISNLPLVHILTFGAHRIKYLWPFKTK